MLASKLLPTPQQSIALPTYIGNSVTWRDTGSFTITIGKPAPTVQGDLMIAFLGATDPVFGGAGWSGSAGWTTVVNQTVCPNLKIAYKIAGASEPGSYTFTFTDNDNDMTACILTYRNCTFDTVGTLAVLGNPLILPSINTSVANCTLLAVGFKATSSLAAPAVTGMTLRGSKIGITELPVFGVSDQSISAAGATGTRSLSNGSGTANRVSGVLMSLKPV
jgi:hypothetical protein